MNDTNRRIFELIHSNENAERLGGILAIGALHRDEFCCLTPIFMVADRLLDFEGEESATKITRFANYLRNVLPGGDPAVTLAAARTLGTLNFRMGCCQFIFANRSVGTLWRDIDC